MLNTPAGWRLVISASIAGISVSSLYLSPRVSLAEPQQASEPAVRSEMSSVFDAFRRLQPFLLDKRAFVNPENHREIADLITTLSERFHKVETIRADYERDPSFEATLSEMSEMLADSKRRFEEGGKDYAHWRLRSASEHCVTCHTRYEVGFDFSGPLPDLAGKSGYELGQYYMASRQFEKAAAAFLDFAKASPEIERMDAFRKWLIIYTRVSPDPRRAITELTRIRAKTKLSSFEDEEIVGWLESLRRWQNESSIAIDPVRKARHLIEQGRIVSARSHQRGAVELLRASSILHRQLEAMPTTGPERSEVLYLLGVVYKEMPFAVGDELPEVFFEAAIRETPNTALARKAYADYSEIKTLRYTGSAGTSLPSEERDKLRGIRALAYGPDHSEQQGR